MALVGNRALQVEVKSQAEKFWAGINNAADLLPELCPEKYKSIEVVEGDGKSVGSVRHIKFTEENPMITFVKERIDTVDEPNMTVGYSVVDGDLLNFYKSFKAKLQVIPKNGDGVLVKWTIEYEKANEEIPEPDFITDGVVKIFTEVDACLLQNKESSRSNI